MPLVAIEEPAVPCRRLPLRDRSNAADEGGFGLRVLLLSWHAEDGAVGAGGHRRTVQLVNHFERWGRLTIVDNNPSMFGDDRFSGTVHEYRLPTLPRVTAADHRLARAVQWPWAAVAMIRKAASVHRTSSFDAIYVPNSEILPCLLAGVVLRRLLGCPLTLANMNVGGVLLARLVVALHNVADAVITLSPGLADALADRGLRQRAWVVGCGSPVLEEPGDEVGCAKEWDAVFVGRHTRAKGVMELLDLWETMRARRPLGRLAMIGSCSEEMARLISARCDASPLLDGSVVRLGVLREREKNRVLAASRLLLFPSGAEGWGFVPLEALCRGVPVVCWDLPAYQASLPEHPSVTRVPQGDRHQFASRALDLLELADEALVDLALGAVVESTSWEEIAEQEWRVISSHARRGSR